MAQICTTPDVAAVLRAEVSAFPGIIVVEHTSQPEDFSPKVGWDFMAPESARQFQVEVGEDWALATLDADGDVLIFDVPAYSRAADHLINALATVLSAVSQVTGAQNIRQAQSKDTDDLSAAVIKTVVK